jgi:quinol monooxygenase YgiN
MLSYQIKIDIKPYKLDEFTKSMHDLSPKIRKQKGCLGYTVYRDSEKENTYSVIGEWKTSQAMDKHFHSPDFEVLIGAARVLGETFAMNIAEVSKKGGLEMVRKQIASRLRKGAVAD